MSKVVSKRTTLCLCKDLKLFGKKKRKVMIRNL